MRASLNISSTDIVIKEEKLVKIQLVGRHQTGTPSQEQQLQPYRANKDRQIGLQKDLDDQKNISKWIPWGGEKSKPSEQVVMQISS